jgi:hypothetical protein
MSRLTDQDEELACELILSKARLMGLGIVTTYDTGKAPIGKAFKGRGHWLALGGLAAHKRGCSYVEMLELFDQGFDDAPYDPRMA